MMLFHSMPWRCLPHCATDLTSLRSAFHLRRWGKGVGSSEVGSSRTCLGDLLSDPCAPVALQRGGLTLHTRSRTSTEVPQETILNVTQRILQQGSISLVTLRLTEGEKCLGRLEPDVTWAVGATFTADCHY